MFKKCTYVDNTLSQIIQENQATLLLGVSGSGKSTIIKDISKNSDYKCLLTSTTGISAVNLSGRTIHAAIGYRIGFSLSEILMSENFKKIFPDLQKIDLIIIDEISMLSNQIFTLADNIFRTITKNYNTPFGGKKILMTGDFFQLPPVSDEPDPWVFQSKTWGMLNPQIIYLTKIHRQKDKNFIKIVEELKLGNTSKDIKELLRPTFNKDISKARPVKIRAYNKTVDRINDLEFNAVSGKEKTSIIKLSGEQPYIQELKFNLLPIRLVKMKIGCRIMTIVNNPKAGYMNGSLGTITGFKKNNPIIKFDSREDEITVTKHSFEIQDNINKKKLATAIQYPIKLAYALTVHKCQSLTLDAVDYDLSGTFAPGMAYVAISRCKTLDNLSIKNYDPDLITASPVACDWFLENCNEFSLI